MKPLFKLPLAIIALLLVTTISCKKHKPYMADAVITGFDQRFCACCGGLMITFNGETRPYTGEFYLVENDPREFGLELNSPYPVYLKVDYILDPAKCPGNKVTITRWARRE